MTFLSTTLLCSYLFPEHHTHQDKPNGHDCEDCYPGHDGPYLSSWVRSVGSLSTEHARPLNVIGRLRLEHPAKYKRARVEVAGIGGEDRPFPILGIMPLPIVDRLLLRSGAGRIT